VDEDEAPLVKTSTTAPHLTVPVPELIDIRTPRFRIRATPAAAGPAAFLAAQIEHLRDEIRDVIGRDWPGVTEVRLGFGRDEYEALTPDGSRPPSWAVALAWPELNIVLVEAHSLVQGDGQITLRHELVHVALGQLGKGWPRWFQEGLAQELTGERKYRLAEYAILARAVRQDRIFRFDDLGKGFPPRPEDVEIAYAQSAAFVSFLRQRHEPAKLGQLIDEVGTGLPFETAFARVFHSSLQHEERLFTQELPSRYPIWPLVTGGSTLWAGLSLLLVVAYARRRRAVRAHRAELAAQEALEDAAIAALAPLEPPANDNVEGPPPSVGQGGNP
jgi:hypothetical protein